MKYPLGSKPGQFDVAGIGNAIVDVLARVDDSFIDQENLTKGTMALIEPMRMLELYGKLKAERECSGGSVANTMAALAGLGARTAYMGRVHADKFGTLFKDDMQRLGVRFDNRPVSSGKQTACCLVCVTPDGERTMNTHLGACTEMEPADIHDDQIEAASIVYIEGYLWDQPSAKEAIRHALSVARHAGTKVAFTLSDLFCVERHRAEFLTLIASGVDILFANEQESQALFETQDMGEIIRRLDPITELAAITCGSDGAIVTYQGEHWSVPTEPVGQVVDATGAGDLFAAGFLYGVVQGWELEQCAALGNRCAGEIIRQIGARATQSLQRLVA